MRILALLRPRGPSSSHRNLRSALLLLCVVPVAVDLFAADRVEDKAKTRKKPAAVVAQRLSRSSTLSREGGSKSTEDAVAKALDWLARHQSPDGGWQAAEFVKQCKTPCKNKNIARDGDGRGSKAFDLGVTGLALIAFVGAGHSHVEAAGEARSQALQRAVGALLSVQERTGSTAGRIGGGGEQWVYEHAIATLALTELLLLSGDEATLKAPVTEAVRLCLKAQNPGKGWRYGVQPQDNDSSITGWMVLALQAASRASLDISRKEFDSAFQGSLWWFNRVTIPNGKTGYMAPGDEGSRLAIFRDEYPFDKSRIQSMTAISTLCRLISGAKRKDALLVSGVKLLSENPPLWRESGGGALSTVNYYYWFHGANAIFQQGGPTWKSWSKGLNDALVKNQRTDGDEKGSWDPLDDWGRLGGRVYSTALGALALEVYYRYPRAKDGVGF